MKQKNQSKKSENKISIADISAIFLLTVFAFSIRFFALDQPREYYFDEIYYAPAAKAYTEMKKDPNWVHPPFAKIVMASCSVFSKDDFLKWRLGSIICGSLMIPLIYLLALYLFKKSYAAILASFLLSIDFLHLVQSRISTLDIFLAFFMLISAFFLWLAIEDKEINLKHFYISAIFAGFASACKWSGIFMMFFVFAIIFIFHRKNFFKNILIYTSIFITAYFSSYIFYFIEGGNLKELYDIFERTLKFQYKGGWTHNYMSPIWKWPILARPIWYYYKVLDTGKCAGIIALGNPLFWIPFLVFFINTAFRAILKRNKVDVFLTIGYLFSFIFWIFSNRGGFFYYMTPVVAFMALITAQNLYNIKNKAFLYGYLAICFTVFCLYYPFMTAIPVNSAYMRSLFFLRFWI